MSDDVCIIKDNGVDLQQRILRVMQVQDNFCKANREQYLEFIEAGGFQAFSDILRTEWPSNGDFAASSCPSDIVVTLAPDIAPELLGWGPVSGQAHRALRGRAAALHRSLRRAVADALAAMSENRMVVIALHQAGLFQLSHFPQMLQSSIERYVPGLSFSDQREHPDQGQQIAERLLALAANAAAASEDVASFLVAHCAVVVHKAFKDPWMVKWEPKHRKLAISAATAAGRKQLAKAVAATSSGSSKSSSTGSGAGRVWPGVMAPGLTAAAVREQLAVADAEAARDQLTRSYSLFLIAILPVCTEEDLLRFVEEGDALARVNRCQNHPCLGDVATAQRLYHVLQRLSQAWDNKARRLSREMAAARRAGPDARALSLRQEGNVSFKDGDYKAALASYMSALEATPDDALLYSNISLTHLKLGNVNEAFDAALSGLAHDATNAKVWVRMGDACRDAGRWQLAQLAYSAALSLSSSRDPEVESRHSLAVSHLERVWSWDEVPIPWDTAAQAVWMQLGKQPTNPGAFDAWLRKAEREMEKLAHTSRSVACQLKEHLLTARAVGRAAAGEIARLPAFHDWQMSWSDTPARAPVSGRVRYMISIADVVQSCDNRAALAPSPSIVEGEPGLTDCLHALARACFHTPNGMRPNKPTVLEVAYRMLSIYDELKAIVTGQWGIGLTIESKAEALRSAVQYDTDYMGRNFADTGYKKETLLKIKSKLTDPHNDHAKGSAAAKGAAAAQATTATARSDPGAGSSSSAGAGTSRTSSSGGKGKDGKKTKQQQQRRPALEPAAARQSAAAREPLPQELISVSLTPGNPFEAASGSSGGGGAGSSAPEPIYVHFESVCRQHQSDEWKDVLQAIRRGSSDAAAAGLLARLL